MNVFCLDSSPTLAAQYLCDKHINKMIVESAQMLANAFSLERLAKPDCPRSQKGQPRSHGYPKHPCTIWTYETKANADWLCNHALAMSDERHYRWEDKPEHFSIAFIKWCKSNLGDSIAPDGNLTDFAIAISNDMKCRTSVKNFDDLTSIEKYRFYYQYDKPFVKWTKRHRPHWFKDNA